MATRIGILEDDTLTRAAISDSLSRLGFEIAISAGSASEFLSMQRIQSIDAALLDLHLGEGPTGLDVAVALRKLDKSMGIVMLTSFEDPRILRAGLDSMPAGCRYLVKQKITDLEQLKTEIEKACSDPGSPLQGFQSPLEQLSNDQVEILRLIADGYSNSEIAKERFMSEKTVESHIAKIIKTLRLRNKPGGNSRVHMAQVYFEARGVRIRRES